MVDTVSRAPTPLGAEPTSSTTHAAPVTVPSAPPIESKLLAMMAEQIEQFTQSHLTSQANHFATTHGCQDEAAKADLGKLLQTIAQLLTQLVQNGHHGTPPHDDQAGLSDTMKQNRLRAEQEVNDLKEQTRIDEMITVARMEAKQAKESRRWIIQNLM